MTTELQLAELLNARFCHDLAGPIGAVNNGIEFLAEDNFDMKEQAMALAEASAREAVARLQFFRQAYGAVPEQGEANIEHIKELTNNLMRFGKVTLDWPDQHTNAAGISIGHRMGKLIMNMVILCSSMLIHGGTVSIRLEKLPEGQNVTITGMGKDIKCEPDYLVILRGSNDAPAMDKRNVQVFFTARLIQQLGVNLSVKQNDNSVSFMLERIKAL